MATLYIVATPIGNLEDITLRAIRILKEVDIILCEDTRVTKKLLNHYNITTTTISYHQHSSEKKVDQITSLIQEGKTIALVTDAGTPGLSDPGGVLVHELRGTFGKSLDIIPIPGVSALTALISVAGIPMDLFVFLGFFPHKKGRQTLYKEIADSKRTVIFYESPHRIIKTLEALAEYITEERTLVIGRELTKKFETVYVGPLKEVTERIKENIKGEFVVAIAGKK